MCTVELRTSVSVLPHHCRSTSRQPEVANVCDPVTLAARLGPARVINRCPTSNPQPFALSCCAATGLFLPETLAFFASNSVCATGRLVVFFSSSRRRLQRRFGCRGLTRCMSIKAAHDDTARHAAHLHPVCVRADRGRHFAPIRGSILRPRAYA